jgi:REP element-mobilizing transposase RayT
MHAYLAGTLRELNCPVVDVGGVSDHVHILFQLSRTLSVAETVSRVKGSSSKWFKADCPRFYWQEGYGTFSVGLEGLQAAIRYVKSQEEHHRKMSFQDEFRGFLVENEMDWDERYVWD